MKSGTSLFLTGVAFDDKDGDKFYDPGEGLSGLTVTATSSSGAKFTATTEPAGGYDMVLAPGTYSVAFSGTNIVSPTAKTIAIGSLNVKVDLVDPVLTSSPPPPPPPPSGSGTINGTSSGDTLHGSSGNDVISGLGGSDRLYGEVGADTINGEAGRDYIYGGLGVDTLTGGDSYDAFVFDTALSGGIDRILDFSHTYDTIRLENAVFTALTDGLVDHIDSSTSARAPTMCRIASSTILRRAPCSMIPTGREPPYRSSSRLLAPDLGSRRATST